MSTTTASPMGADTKASGHVIVCGLHGVALRAVEQLHLSGVEVIIIDEDPDPRLAQIIEGWGIRQIRQNATLGGGLIAASIAHCRAVICCAPSDILTLEIALGVREIRPDVRIVVELANASVGRALERVIGVGSVIDVAEIAAPSFVEACLGLATHEMTLGGERFAVVQVTVSGDEGYHETFRSHFGNLAPVAITTALTGAMAVCPGRDAPVAVGDHVAVLGTPAEFERSDLDVVRAVHAPPPRVPHWRLLHRRISAILATNARGLVISVSLLFSLVILSTLIIHLGYLTPARHHLGVLNSLYFSVETIATVGFGDYFFAGQGDLMLTFAIVLIIAGVALVSTSFALFTNILVSRRIEQSLGRRPIPGLAGHTVVIGLGSVGIGVIERLVTTGERCVIIERDANNRELERARALGVPIVIGDATQPPVHRQVNLADARAIAILTSSDLTNIETGLAVHESLGDQWERVPVVMRVFDQDLARMMGQSFGFHHVRSTAALAAPWFVGAALGLDVIETFYFEDQPFLVGRLEVSSTGGLEGLQLGDLSSRTRVIAIRRAAEGAPLEHPPRRGTRFAGGDEVFLLGPYEELLSVLRRNGGAHEGAPASDARGPAAE